MFRGHPNIARRWRAVPTRAAVRGAIAMAAVVGLAACGSGGDRSSSAGGKTPTIAFVSQGTSNSWAAQLDAVARKTAKALGVKLVYFNGEGDATKQLPKIQSAIAQRPDAMVLVPLGQAADTGPVERAMAAGIKVVLCASTVNTQNYTSLVNPNPETATVPLAQWLATKMHNRGNLLYIGGLPGNFTTTAYDKGFFSVMKQNPNIHVVNAGNANYSISTAKQLAATAIASGKKFDGAWGVGGEAVTGLMQAYVDSRVRQFPPTISQLCIDTAVKAVKGQPVPKYINISALPQYADIFPPLDKYYKPQYSDDLYTGTDTVLSAEELKSLNLLK